MRMKVDMSRMQAVDVTALCGTRELSDTVDRGASATVRSCHNLRQSGIGVKAVGNPQKIAACEGKPVYTDCINSDIYLFTQLDDGTVCVSRGGKERTLVLGRVEEEVCQGASVGNFVVLRLQSGSLVYLLREEALGGYTWLGELPQLPSFRLEVRQEPEVSVEMEGCRFSTLLTDVSNPVPAEVSEKVVSSWRDATMRLYEQIRGGGAWCEPIRVQLALRLWDGTRLDVSEPIRLSPAQKPGRERVSVGLLYSESKKGFTGTDGTTISGNGFTFTVTMDEDVPGVWSGIVTGVEVWVSREVEAIAEERVPVLTFMHNTSGNFVSFMPTFITNAEVDAAVESMPMGLVSFCSMPGTPGRITLPTGVVYDSGIEDYAVGLPDREVSCILGYGGFLHTGSGHDLYTSVRGNPLVVKSVSRGLGASVLSLCPQLCGGGAFTRQYIYVSTRRGVVALCHKADGTHTNSRPISQERLCEAQLWQATPKGVYALSAEGALLCLRDATATMLYVVPSDVTSLIWSNYYEELWLCREKDSMVLQTAYSNHLYTRGDSYRPIAGMYAPSWIYSIDEQGCICIYTPECESENSMSALYERSVPMSGGGCVRRIVVLMSGEEKISYRLSDDAGMSLNRGEMPQAVESVLAMNTMLTRVDNNPVAWQRRLWFRIKGNIKEIKEIQVWG